MHWNCEKLISSSNWHPRFGTCCLQGKIALPILQPLPVELLQLYDGTSNHSDHFLQHINSYNNVFAMVSIGHRRVPLGPGPETFIVQGEVRHRMGSLLPEPGHVPVYAQLYFVTPEEALELCVNPPPGNNRAPLRREIVQILQDMLHRNNHYVGLYKSVGSTIVVLQFTVL
ncbi:hypothetical protein AMATHDRAFT_138861 [Amanita thiersii Skay4041]|uniref:Uncharacterized protein n=1 Tax=Amanita thiersii Skay4041 TaxID=703135 RepID=A0A2A9NUH9_9AGAR|nr:hypothetical protein AMATHDRAFT_138861 [Amanita thiersii Skay4041]